MMRARTTPSLALLALVAGLALAAACGTGLYSAEGAPAVPGGDDACDPGPEEAVCGGRCVPASATRCGLDCVACPAPSVSRNLGAATAACIAQACDYECTGGLLKCEGGCCKAVEIAAGGAFTCARLEDGSVKCWGADSAGQVTGVPSQQAGGAPPHTIVPANAAAIGTGTAHACAALSTGAVACWGANDAGQAPPIAGGVAGATSLALGARHSCAIVASGAVRCWGSGAGAGGTQPVVASGATEIAAGADHTCAVVGGAVQCWGSNASGQLGNGTRAGSSATPIPSGIAHVAARGDHTCASTGTSNGTNLDDALRCWGNVLGEAYGLQAPQLDPAIPLREPGRASVRFAVAALATGSGHVCVWKGDATESVACFGPVNDMGELGAVALQLPALEPLPVTSGLAPGRPFAAGARHACAIAGDGSVWCWGADADGQLGSSKSGGPGSAELVRPSGR